MYSRLLIRKLFPTPIPLQLVVSDSCIPFDCSVRHTNWKSSDRGSQFTSQLWKSISEFLCVQLHHTTSLSPSGSLKDFIVTLSLLYVNASLVQTGFKSYFWCSWESGQHLTQLRVFLSRDGVWCTHRSRYQIHLIINTHNRDLDAISFVKMFVHSYQSLLVGMVVQSITLQCYWLGASVHCSR